jgi:hypothetical protein
MTQAVITDTKLQTNVTPVMFADRYKTTVEALNGKISHAQPQRKSFLWKQANEHRLCRRGDAFRRGDTRLYPTRGFYEPLGSTRSQSQQ